jgi:DNA mismatch repair ATPase MutS
VQRPLCSTAAIAQRQDCVEFFMVPECTDFAAELHKILSKFRDVEKILSRLGQSRPSVKDWGGLIEVTALQL